MGQASRRSGQLSDDCRTEVAQRIIDFLRRRYRDNVALNVAADTGIPDETVQKMIDRVSMPSAMNYFRLWNAYGPEFLLAAHPRAPRWLSDAHRRERKDDLDSRIAALEAERARL